MRVFQTVIIKTAVLWLPFVVFGAINGQTENWRGIVPLHSTRADVERLLGSPNIDRSDLVVYDGETEQASIQYSKGPCEIEFSPWNVPRDTVISIFLDPKPGRMLAADVRLDAKSYTKRRDDHVSCISHYIDEEHGVRCVVDEKRGEVTSIEYFPAAKDSALRCPEPLNRLRETIKFDEYSDISLSKEKKRLDKFAQQLVRYSSTNYASAEGHILVYGRKHARIGVAMARALRARNYLVKVRGINPDRLQTRDAGFRQKLTIELYLVPPGGPIPPSKPTVDPKYVPIIKGSLPKNNR